MDGLRDKITAIVSDAMITAGKDWAARRTEPTRLPTEFADRILAIPEIAEALDAHARDRKLAAEFRGKIVPPLTPAHTKSIE